MESGVNSLTVWKLEKARKTLTEAEDNLKLGHYENSSNRSYYAVFYAIQAVNSMHRFDSRKHSGVIAYFRKTFLKTGILAPELSKIITETYHYRERADYEAMYEADLETADKILSQAKVFVAALGEYLRPYFNEAGAKANQNLEKQIDK